MIENITYRHLETGEKSKAKAAIENYVAKDIEPLLHGFDANLVRLHGLVERHTQQRLYRAVIELRLPRKVLAAHEEGADVELVLRDAFAELARQLKRYKSLLKNEPLWRRPARRRQLREMTKGAGAAEESTQRELFRDLIKGHLEGLYNFVRREVAYRTAADELLPGQLTADDVVDSVVARAYERQEEKPAHLALDRWLRQLALEVIEEEAAKRPLAERMVSLETPVVVGKGDEEDGHPYEDYAPEEVLRLEDLLATPGDNDPADVLQRYELSLRTQQLLAWLPRLWRQVLVLGDVEGLSDDEIATVLGLSPAQVATLRQFAESYLREKLRDSGFTAPNEESSTEQEWVLDPITVDLPAEFAEEILEKFA